MPVPAELKQSLVSEEDESKGQCCAGCSALLRMFKNLASTPKGRLCLLSTVIIIFLILYFYPEFFMGILENIVWILSPVEEMEAFMEQYALGEIFLVFVLVGVLYLCTMRPQIACVLLVVLGLPLFYQVLQATVYYNPLGNNDG